MCMHEGGRAGGLCGLHSVSTLKGAFSTSFTAIELLSSFALSSG